MRTCYRSPIKKATFSVAPSYITELELLQETGFHPIDVIKMVTSNKAKILGMEDKQGRVREGFLADLILIDDNPLQNLKFIFPTAVLDLKNGNLVHCGGVKWTIKNGIVYDTPTLWKDVAGIVSKARAERN